MLGREGRELLKGATPERTRMHAHLAYSPRRRPGTFPGAIYRVTNAIVAASNVSDREAATPTPEKESLAVTSFGKRAVDWTNFNFETPARCSPPTYADPVLCYVAGFGQP